MLCSASLRRAHLVLPFNQICPNKKIIQNQFLCRDYSGCFSSFKVSHQNQSPQPRWLNISRSFSKKKQGGSSKNKDSKKKVNHSFQSKTDKPKEKSLGWEAQAVRLRKQPRKYVFSNYTLYHNKQELPFYTSFICSGIGFLGSVGCGLFIYYDHRWGSWWYLGLATMIPLCVLPPFPIINMREIYRNLITKMTISHDRQTLHIEVGLFSTVKKSFPVNGTSISPTDMTPHYTYVNFINEKGGKETFYIHLQDSYNTEITIYEPNLLIDVLDGKWKEVMAYKLTTNKKGK